MSIERNIVLVRVETVLVQVKMAEVLTSEYFDGENRIRSVILESELTVVVRAKVCLPPWIPIFEGASSRCGRAEKISSLSSGFCRRKGGNSKKVDLSLAVQSRLERQSSKWPAIENNP